MFLTNADNTVEDFLKAMKFIAPEGKNLKYFIVPINSDNDNLKNAAGFNGFEPLVQNTQNRNITDNKVIDNTFSIPGITDTITYAKRDNKLRQSVSRNNIDPTTIPAAFPITKEIIPDQTKNGTNLKTDVLVAGGEIKPQEAGIKIVESDDKHTDIILKENIGPFPRSTLFHFIGE